MQHRLVMRCTAAPGTKSFAASGQCRDDDHAAHSGSTRSRTGHQHYKQDAAAVDAVEKRISGR
jgi:hypothetical protein